MFLNYGSCQGVSNRKKKKKVSCPNGIQSGHNVMNQKYSLDFEKDEGFIDMWQLQLLTSIRASSVKGEGRGQTKKEAEK